MFTIFFTKSKSLIAEDLPKCQKHNQDDFISDILPNVESEKIRRRRRKQGGTFRAHIGHSKNPDGAKIRGQFDTKGVVRSPHPPHAPDLSPCGFWFFGMAKGEMKDRELHPVQDIRRRLTENGVEHYRERSKKNGDLLGAHFQGILSATLSGHPVYRRYLRLKSNPLIRD
jgi:hypothetical protein